MKEFVKAFFVSFLCMLAVLIWIDEDGVMVGKLVGRFADGVPEPYPNKRKSDAESLFLLGRFAQVACNEHDARELYKNALVRSPDDQRISTALRQLHSWTLAEHDRELVLSYISTGEEWVVHAERALRCSPKSKEALARLSEIGSRITYSR